MNVFFWSLCVVAILMQRESFASNNVEETEDEDLLDDELSRQVLEKWIQTTIHIFKNEDLRDDIITITKRVNQLFENEMALSIINGFTTNLVQVLLVPENLHTLSKLTDIGSMVLLDAESHKVIDRELKLVDRFLEDPLVKKIYSKIGNMLAFLTTNEEIYNKNLEILDQAGLFLTKQNMKTMADFLTTVSRELTGGVPQF